MSAEQLDPELQNIGFVRGKIFSVYSNDSGYFTGLSLPGEDEFSSSSRVQVLSENRLGNEGEVVQCSVRLDGYQEKIKGSNGKPSFYKTHNILRFVK